MIYGELVEKSKDFAIYHYGTKQDCLSGVVKINTNCTINIIKPADNTEIAMYWLSKMIFQQRSNFTNGIFKDKISYECG